MATRLTHATAAKAAMADKLSGGASFYAPKYLVFEDHAGVLVLCSNTALGALSTTTVKIYTGTAEAPAGINTAIDKCYLIGDVGAYSIPTLEAAQHIVDGGDLSNYLIYTHDDDGGAAIISGVVAGDTLQETITLTAV